MSAGIASDWRPSKHIRLYAYTWVGYFALLVLLPVSYGSREAALAGSGLLLWAAGSVAIAYFVDYKLRARQPVTCVTVGLPLRIPRLERMIWIALLTSLLGFVSLAYDRIGVQAIDFSQGIAVARELWRQAGEERTGVSSPFSVLGYLFGFSFFAATALAHLQWELISRVTRWGVILITIVLVVGNSLLTGGRSVVMVQLACMAATAGIRGILGMQMMPGRGVRIWAAVGLVIITSIGYSLYVFSERAAAGNILPERYVVNTLDYLGGRPSDSFYELQQMPEFVAGTSQFAIAAGAYLSHSYGTFESVLDSDTTPGSVSFAFIRQLLSRFGLGEDVTQSWLLAGRLLSFPGALWYDYGWWGFYAGAVVTGLLIGLIPRILAVPTGGGLSVAVAILIFISGLLSPLVPAIDVLSVPFMLIGFFEIDLLGRLWGSNNWLYVSRPFRLASMDSKEVAA